ncbi:MAG TPA: MFS transporter, partial [Dongiaceae bacterium]|nr:MFS transporter [Dongiaceae bacterium]
GGRLADRFDRRTVLMVAQLLAMAATAVLAVLAAVHAVTIAAVMVVAVLVGVQFAISLPTMMALLPALVEPEQLGLAIGMNSITYNVARALGPALATVIVGTLGFGITFGLNSLSFFVLFVTLGMLHPRARKAASESTGGAAGAKTSTRELFAYAWGERRIRLPLLGMAALAIAFAPIVTLAPTFARDVFGRPSADAGLLISGFGLGAILAALALTRMIRGHGRARLELLVPGGLLFVAGMVVLAFAPTMGVAIGGLAVAGVGYLLSSVTWTTSLQEVVRDDLRGRVMALWALSFIGLWPLAAPIGGIIADSVSPRAAVLTLLVPLVVSTLVVVPAARRAAHAR